MTVDSEWVVLDVGGEKFHARKNIFLEFPGTRLGKKSIKAF